MDSVLAQRKLVELRCKIGGLEAEFKYWCEQSEQGKPFRKHHTQIRAIKNQLESLQSKIRDRLKQAEQVGNNDASKILSAGRAIQQMLLAVHRIWEYFRSKLVQRDTTFLAGYLQAADEFAWACYQPIQARVYPDLENGRRKEPPLVFLNGGSSPFSVSREKAFQPEEVPNEILSGSELKAVLDALPIPVVGVPWHQVQHLPDALVIGHEVGHIIEDEFDLKDQMEKLLNDALALHVDKTHHAAWNAWLGEIFADLYGCMAVGPAFVGSLADFLAIDPSRIGIERRIDPNWGLYPTNYLRMLINLRALVELGFRNQSNDLKQTWSAAYPNHQMTEYDNDVNVIVPTLLRGRYTQLGGASLLEMIGFSSDQQDEAEATVAKLTDGETITTTDIRVLFAAMRLAYERHPHEFSNNDYTRLILKRVEELATPATRANEQELDENQQRRRDEQNEAAGSELFERLFKLAADLESHK